MGLEPTHLSILDPKSSVTTNSTTRAYYLRSRLDLNQRKRFCRPPPNHSDTGPFLIVCGPGGFRTPDAWIFSPTLYQLSYQSIICTPGRSRTSDTRIWNPLLYQLSYWSVLGEWWVSIPLPSVPQTDALPIELQTPCCGKHWNRTKYPKVHLA